VLAGSWCAASRRKQNDELTNTNDLTEGDKKDDWTKTIDLKIMKPRRNEEHEAKNAKSEVVLALLRGLPSSSSLLRGEISFS
jgi:hypothetical protein